MIVPAIKYTYLFMIGVAFLFSLLSFRAGLPIHLKLLALFLGLTFVMEICTAFFLKSTYLVYSLYGLIEFWVYGFFFYQLIRVKVLRWIIFLFLWIFPIFWFVTSLYVFKFHRWNSYVTVTGSFCVILFVLMYYYQLIIAKDVKPIRRRPEFWIATGMLMFYLWELPYFGTLNFFLDYYIAHPGVNNGLLNARLILDTLMYAFISYGYLCGIINTAKYSSS